jgi:hypothetical protein
MKPDHPKTFARFASPGELLKRPMAVATRIRLRAVSDDDPVYLARVRQCMCVCCGLDPACVAAHVRMQSGTHGKRSGMGKKPADKWALPVCQACHTDDPDSQHRIGEIAFWNRVGLNPVLLCERLYAQRGDLLAMRAVIMLAISERGRAIT